jgi:predicted DsbA family dithiol-disulfide isomerase
MAMQEKTSVRVEVVSDAICPWCWIGKRHLERAAERLAGEIRVETVWKPFELNQDMPKGGMERSAYRLRKFGSLDFSAQLDAQVAEAGRAAGLDFRHDLMKWTPNTIDCHRLIWYAGQIDKQDAFVEDLFQAYFSEGRNIGDPIVLMDIAEKQGLERSRVEALLAGDEGTKEVERELGRARSLGISGVPTFLMGGSPAVSGAAPSEMLAQAIAEMAAETTGSFI